MSGESLSNNKRNESVEMPKKRLLEKNDDFADFKKRKGIDEHAALQKVRDLQTSSNDSVTSSDSSGTNKSGQENYVEYLRSVEAALNLGPLNPFVATRTQMQVGTVSAKIRVITLSDSAYMLVLLDHNFELRDTLVYGKSFLKQNGQEAKLPVHFCFLHYTDVYTALEGASEALKKLKLPNLVLPTVQGFKTAATSGGFMVSTTSSRQQVDIALAALRELYAIFVYSDANPYYAGKKVTLDIREYKPKMLDSMVYRVLDKLCAEKTSH